MPEAFVCPSCNAPLDYSDGDDPVVTCQYCKTPVILPDELREQTPVMADQLPGFSGLGENVWQLKEIVRLARADRKIDAIRLYRETFGVGLKEAKDAVEQMVEGKPVVVSSTSTTFQPISIQTQEPGKAASCAGKAFILGIVGIMLLFVGFMITLVMGIPLATIWSKSETQGIATVISSFGGEGTGAGLFTDARHVGVDAEGMIYVSEYSEGRIQVFNPSGEFVTLWTVDNNTPITSMAVNREGIVHLTHSGIIFRHAGSSGELIDQWEHPDGRGFESLATAIDGRLITSWNKHSDDIVRFDAQGNIDLDIKKAISGQTGDSELNIHVAVDGLGNIYALGSFHDAIYIFTPDGKYVTRFAGKGDEPGQLKAPSAIAVDGQNRIYVSDMKGIQIFDKNGRYLDLIDVEGFVFGLAFNDQNELFAVSNTQQVTRYVINLPGE